MPPKPQAQCTSSTHHPSKPSWAGFGPSCPAAQGMLHPALPAQVGSGLPAGHWHPQPRTAASHVLPGSSLPCPLDGFLPHPGVNPSLVLPKSSSLGTERLLCKGVTNSLENPPLIPDGFRVALWYPPSNWHLRIQTCITEMSHAAASTDAPRAVRALGLGAELPSPAWHARTCAPPCPGPASRGASLPSSPPRGGRQARTAQRSGPSCPQRALCCRSRG